MHLCVRSWLIENELNIYPNKIQKNVNVLFNIQKNQNRSTSIIKNKFFKITMKNTKTNILAYAVKSDNG